MGLCVLALRARALVCVAWALGLMFSLPIGIIAKEVVLRDILQCQLQMPPHYWKVS